MILSCRFIWSVRHFALCCLPRGPGRIDSSSFIHLGRSLRSRYRRMSALVDESWFRMGSSAAFEFRDNLLRQHLAQLDAPLIKRIDLPDGSLREDAVLVKGDQLA